MCGRLVRSPCFVRISFPFFWCTASFCSHPRTTFSSIRNTVSSLSLSLFEPVLHSLHRLLIYKQTEINPKICSSSSSRLLPSSVLLHVQKLLRAVLWHAVHLDHFDRLAAQTEHQHYLLPADQNQMDQKRSLQVRQRDQRSDRFQRFQSDRVHNSWLQKQCWRHEHVFRKVFAWRHPFNFCSTLSFSFPPQRLKDHIQNVSHNQVNVFLVDWSQVANHYRWNSDELLKAAKNWTLIWTLIFCL